MDQYYYPRIRYFLFLFFLFIALTQGFSQTYTAPTATSPSAPIVNEDQSNVELADDIHITDEDGDDQTVAFTITGGTLSLGTSGITFSSSGNGSTNFTASGTLANINAALDAATFTPNPNLYGSNAATILFVSNDGTGYSNAASVTFDITGVNDDPTINGLPLEITVEEDSTMDPFDISSATVSDVDAGSGELTLTLTATGGIFDVAAGTGITLSGHLTSQLQITGNLTDLNNYINAPTNIYFRPSENLSGYNGGSVDVSINDNGYTGAGGGEDIFIGTVNVNITAVNDAPQVTLPATITVTEDVNTALTGISFSDVDAETGSVTVDMSVVTGSLFAPTGGGVIISGSGSSSISLAGAIADINAYIAGSNLKFQNQFGNTADQNLNVTIDDNGNTGSGGNLSDSGMTTLIVSQPVVAVVTSVSVPADGTYIAGETMDFIVSFDKDVYVDVSTGMPELSLTIGASTGLAVYVSGSGTSTLVFRYWVQSGDEDTDGIALSPTIEANGGTIQNDGVDADLTLQNVQSAQNLLIDAVAPSGYTVLIDQNQINASNQSNVGFTFSGAEIGTDYNYTFTSSSGGTPVTGSGVIVTATDQISGIDLSGLNDGTITLTATLEDAVGNTGISVVDTSIKSMPITLDITVDAGQSKTYGEADPEFTYTVTGFENGDDESILSGALSRAAGESVGGYEIQLGTLSAGSNYNINLASADFNISLATLDITVDAGSSKTYGEADPELTYTLTGFENGDDESILSGALSRVAGEEVGAYAIQRGTLSAGSNYNINLTSADFNISPATLDITVDVGSSKTYGELDPELTYTVTGFESGDDESILNGALSREAGEEFGTYAIEQGTLSGGSNYVINFIGSVFNISPATLDITVDAGQSKTFGELDPEFTYTVTGFENGDDESILSGALSRVAGESVGGYEIQLGTLSGGTNYTIQFTSSDFNITSVVLDITVDVGQSKTYGELDPELTYTVTGFENGDDESILSGALSREAGEEVGTYAIEQGTLSAESNYVINFIGSDFNISPATLDITVDAGSSKTYGEADPEFTYTVTGFESGDDESILSGTLSRVAGEEVGTYAIEQGTLSGGSDYNINFTSADFNISPATLDITVDAGQSKIFGVADPVFTYTVTGFENGEDKSILSGALSRVPGEEVGTYAIEQGTLSGGTNYTIQFTSADFNITSVVLDITVDAGQSKTYGEADPVFTYTVTGFESGADESILSGVLSRVAGEDVGTYAIELGTLSGGSGYTINFTNADFAVEPAILNITADANSKVYGETDPEFTYHAGGFVTGDDIAIVTGALSRATGEDAGNYPITLGNLSAGINYDLHLESADFEIVKADQEITWSQDLSFGCESDSQVSLTASASSGLPVTYTVADTSIAEVTGNVLSAKASGTTTIIAQQPGDENHHPATSVEKTVLVSQNGLIRQHWDDVLVFDNSSGDFVSYQWYKDGAPVAGATKQYYSENGTLSGRYYVEATTQSGEVIITCVLELSGENFAKSVRLIPNPVRASSTFVVDCSFDEASLSGASISIIDLNGRLMQTVSVTDSQTSLTAPTQTGIYVVVLSLGDGTRKTVNLLVN
ncbi:MBG domain-containing protein [Galbibacter sp.]|uniref:MBG domain-containing protein n=1 Tax=Galbibacter sp. TaxID=2918471 RepID=UPI003A955F54